MKTLTRITAAKLRKGMTFMLSKTECRIISVEKNQFDHMVVRFELVNNQNDPQTGFVVVSEDFTFILTD